jgi:uncharacterized protein
MKIGLLSDTHGALDVDVFKYFKECDEIWHAGDIGDQHLLQSLETFKPTKAVFGNVDTPNLRHSLAEDFWFDCEGLTVWLTHIAGTPPNYTPRIKKILKERKPDILICGHSHILRVIRDATFKMMYINPGAAGNHGFHAVKTIMRFEIIDKKILNMEVIELGKRGAL